MEYKDYYKILGVSRNVDEKELKKAFRKLAQQYHPDKNPGDKEAERKFKEINEAYTILSDPEKRQKYDQFGPQWEQYTRNSGGGGQTRTMSPEEFERIFGGGFGDIFETMFGGGRTTQQTRRRSTGFDPFTGGMPTENEVAVQVTLEEAFRGTTRVLQTSEGTRMEANIPRGVKTGSKVRMRGASGQGDVILKVEVLPHADFTRDGDDLRVKVAVDLYTALLGGEARVPTLERPLVLTIPAGAQNGRLFRLRGQGMPHLKHPDQRGDLLAELSVTLPTNLNDEERRLFQRLRELRTSS